jgi:hypothetical protein
VVHFVGDIHQPLHAGYSDDKGGNSFQVQAFERGTNLHALWDSGLIRNWHGGLQALQVEVMAKAADAGGNAQSWAEESCRIVDTPGFYPPTRKIEAEYAQQWNEVVRSQLSMAGRRLAAVLNASLGPR